MLLFDIFKRCLSLGARYSQMRCLSLHFQKPSNYVQKTRLCDPGYFTNTNQTSKRKQIHQFLRVARILFVKYLRYAAYGRVHKRCKRVHRCCYASIKWLSAFYNWHKSCLLAWKLSIKKQRKMLKADIREVCKSC